jgi:RsiW-degrading membrane proteinase PrsW (M82 family)
MPISITCHGCGKRLKAKDSLAGRTVACPSCGTKLVIDSADDIAAALLRDDAEPQAAEPEAPAPSEDAAPEREAEPPPRRAPIRKSQGKPGGRTDVRGLPPLTTNDPPLWIRHLHWLLVLSLIPLAVSLLQKSVEPNLDLHVLVTIALAPEDSRPRAEQAFDEWQNDKGSLENVFAVLPNHKLVGAWLPRNTLIHWLLTAGAALLFFLFLLVLTLEGSAKAQHLLMVGVFTATVGLLFLFCVQALAEWSQRFIILPTSIVGLVFYIFWLIGFSYRAANDPSSNFFLSLMGFTFGVGLCEEICKALPVIFINSRPNNQSWRGAYLWGLASGAGFGLAEAVLYAGGFYNGISGAGIYFVRNISCVALHALWTGSAAITIHQRQRWFQEDMRWYDWIVRAIAVVAVPMVLHGLYDTLLKKDLNALALAVAVSSFLWLAFQISRLRGADDQTAQADMLREYQRRRNAMPGR